MNCFWLCKTFSYYSKKSSVLKNQNEKEYKRLLWYIWIFRIFPFVLILTGLTKVSSRLIGIFLDPGTDPDDTIIKYLGYFNASIHNLNGFFNSLACFYFFRGVFWCCIDEEEEENNSNEQSQCLKDMNNNEEEEKK